MDVMLHKASRIFVSKLISIKVLSARIANDLQSKFGKLTDLLTC